MHPNEVHARELAAAESRFPLLISTRQARFLLDWGMSEEAVAGWMDWEDDDLRAVLVAFIAEHEPEIVGVRPDMPVWGCFRTVDVNRVRHAPHDWVQADQAQTRYHCDGAE